MTMFADSAMHVTIEDAIKGTEDLLKIATEEGRRGAVRVYNRLLTKLRSQTTEEFRAEMGFEPV